MRKVFDFLKELVSAPTDAAVIARHQDSGSPPPNPGKTASPVRGVLLAYLHERRDLIENSTRPPSKASDEFRSLLLAERSLLNELEMQGNEKLLALYVTHSKWKSVHTVRQTITEMPSSDDELDQQMILSYESRISLLKREIGTIELGDRAVRSSGA